VADVLNATGFLKTGIDDMKTEFGNIGFEVEEELL
jgi:hypothetical protein